MSLSRAHKIEQGPKVEINVIPLVDVSLVLLIIFMVTATFMKVSGVSIQLPTSGAARPLEQAKQELVISVLADGCLRWQGMALNDAQLAGVLQEQLRTRGPEVRVLVQGDARAAYGRVMEVTGIVKQMGFTRVAFVAKREKEAP